MLLINLINLIASIFLSFMFNMFTLISIMNSGNYLDNNIFNPSKDLVVVLIIQLVQQIELIIFTIT